MTEQDYFPWDDIPDADVLPTGDFHVRGAELVDKIASTGKRMFSAQIAVEEPTLYAGMTLFENFVVGSDEAPKSILPGLLGTRMLKKMLGAAQIPGSNNSEKLCMGFENALFGISVSEYTEKEGEYAGSPRNRITKFWKRGERVPGIATGAKGKGPAAVASAAAESAGAPVPAPPPPPPLGGEVGAPVAQPTILEAPAKPAAVTQPPAPATVAPAAPLALDAQAGSIALGAAPAVPAAPVGPVVAPVGPPIVQTTVTPEAAKTIPCPMCQQMFTPEEFSVHVPECSKQRGGEA